MKLAAETAGKSALSFPGFPECCEEKQSSPLGGGRITPQWQLSLDALIDGLERLPAMTELRFLKVGAMLQEISARLLTIGEGAEMAARMMAGEKSLSVIRDMEQLLDRLEDEFLVSDLAASQSGNVLEQILGEFSDMERLLESFKGHVGNLRTLKLLTNIQVAALQQRGVSFRNVATDIGTLSQNINAKSNAILSRVKTLSGELAKGRTMVAVLGVTQKQLNRTMVGAVRSKIAIMAEMHGNCSLAAADISNRSGEISRDIGSIVVALQFQDITRQQIEHARDALVGVRKGVAAAKGSSAGILSDELAGICVLQSAQLTNSADQLLNAVTGIAASLRGVSREAADSAARVHGLFRQADGIGRSSLADIELSMGSLAGAFAESMKVRERLADIIQAMTGAMGEITGFAGEIDFLGAEIRLIALNAIIKAAQAGKEGAAFSVIAENIKQQSDDICRQVAVINTTIQTISRHVVDLHKEMRGEGERSSLLRREELAITVDRLRELIDEAGGLLLCTDEAAASMAETIAGTTAALSSRELIATLQSELRPRILRLAVGLGQHDNRSDDVHGAELRYTMESERAVHQRFLGKVDSGNWSGEPGKGLLPASLADDNHFASNVELF